MDASSLVEVPDLASPLGRALVAVYLLVNLLSLFMYAWDKHKARVHAWRTSERALLLWALLGPWGAVLGMRLAHHKTRKLKFKLVLVFCVIHGLIILWLLGDLQGLV